MENEKMQEYGNALREVELDAGGIKGKIYELEKEICRLRYLYIDEIMLANKLRNALVKKDFVEFDRLIGFCRFNSDREQFCRIGWITLMAE